MQNIIGLDSSKMSTSCILSKHYIQDVSGSTYQKVSFQVIEMIQKANYFDAVHITFTGREWENNSSMRKRVRYQLMVISKYFGKPVLLNNVPV